MKREARGGSRERRAREHVENQLAVGSWQRAEGGGPVSGWQEAAGSGRGAEAQGRLGDWAIRQLGDWAIGRSGNRPLKADR